MKDVLILVDNDCYKSSSGYVMQREHGVTPSGNTLAGRWVLWNSAGEMLDFDRYRSDLAERHNLDIEK